MTETISQIFDSAADLLEPEGRWTQGASGRDANGYAVPTDDIAAVCFCFGGAIYRISPDLESAAWGFFRREAGESIERFNDCKGRKQSEVVTVARDMAERAREQGL